MRYRGPPEGTTRHIRLDAMTAIFDRRSGMTHLVAAPVPDLLAVLAMADVDIDGFAQCLGAEDERAGLVERIEELVATGLVEAL